MVDHMNLPVCISGKPSEQEMVAIIGAYTSLLEQIGDKSGENAVETVDCWVVSSKNMVVQGQQSNILPGKMRFWQQNLRVASRR